MEKGACFQRLLYISSAVPNEQGCPICYNVIFFSKSPLRGLPLWSTNGRSMERSLLSELVFTYISESPVKDPSL
jgi:hypothetical protein